MSRTKEFLMESQGENWAFPFFFSRKEDYIILKSGEKRKIIKITEGAKK